MSVAVGADVQVNFGLPTECLENNEVIPLSSTVTPNLKEVIVYLDDIELTRADPNAQNSTTISGVDFGNRAKIVVCGHCEGHEGRVTGDCIESEASNPSDEYTIGGPNLLTVTWTEDTPPPPGDEDGDGVDDSIDQCPGTPAGWPVDSVGCPTDGDGDGVPDGADLCPGTPFGEPVDAEGCPLPDPPSCVPQSAFQCTDLCDNDNDGLIDRDDPQCQGAQDNDESQ